MSYGGISMIRFKSICRNTVKEDKIIDKTAIDNIIGKK
jgi:hypothetical protein